MALTRGEIMARVRRRDTAPERAVRRLVTGLGVRYRLDVGDLPGRPDLAHKGDRWAVFVHGCFWHQCRCRGGRTPKTNVRFWHGKFRRNKARDLETIVALRRRGYRVLVVWECELRRPERVRARLAAFLNVWDE